MKEFKALIVEINKTLNSLIIFDYIITTILLFLATYLFLSLFNLYPVFAAVPAVIYLVTSISKSSNINKMKAVESKYDNLKEKLRTAADNSDTDNPVVNELQEEVVEEVKNVGISSFLKPRSLSYKIFFCIVMAFSIVFISTFHLSFLDADNLIKQIPQLFEKKALKGATVTGFEDVNLTEDIYSDKELAILGNQEINIKIKPANFRVSVKESGDTEEKAFDEIFPQDVFVESSETFKEEIPLEEQELVKTYFKKITQ